jgi:hypothetical protein
VCTRALRLVALVLLATACTGNAAPEAVGSLKSGTLSPKYHSGLWADEAGKQTGLWKEAQQLCRAQEASPTPNCRVVFAVDTTVRVIAVHQDEDIGERLKAWIRGGTGELGLSTSSSMPSPAKGFGPEPPKMPASAGKCS